MIGENTIVGDAFEAGDEPHLNMKEHPHKPASVKGKGRADQFVATMDYTLKNAHSSSGSERMASLLH